MFPFGPMTAVAWFQMINNSTLAMEKAIQIMLYTRLNLKRKSSLHEELVSGIELPKSGMGRFDLLFLG